jgi:CheY-like chemotaxis protein
MGGRIWVESEPGRGSVFHFTADFPVTGAHLAAPPGARLASPGAETNLLKGLNVLIIDPNANCRRILRDMLRRWEMTAVLAGSTQDALAAAEQAAASGQRFDAVLADAHTPAIDAILGPSAEFQPATSAPRIVLLNSLDSGTLSAGLRESGRYIVKPVTPQSLSDTLLRVLGKKLAPAAAPASRIPERSRHQLHILLAEDNVVNQKVAARLVERLGHSVQVAANGEQAIEACTKQKFDLILMDIQMPVMNGYDASRAIRASEQGTDRHVPIVALTAHAMKDDRGICLQAGMDDYLAKPIHPGELAAALERWGAASGHAETARIG